MNSEDLIVFFISGLVMVGGGMLVSHFFAPSSNNPQKSQAYECGVPTVGSNQFQFRVGYYLFAIIFLVFEVEVVFLFPWATVLKESGMAAFVEAVVFLFILAIGLLYAWKKNALRWQ